jgi:predicted transcriptional regulator
MSRLENAAKRVEDALLQLERAIEARATDPGAADDSELAAQLRQTQAEFAELKVVTTEVTDRLDAVIERLRRSLED